MPSFEYYTRVINHIMCNKCKGRENVVNDAKVSVADASAMPLLCPLVHF